MTWYQWTGCIGGNLALLTLIPFVFGARMLVASLKETWQEVQDEAKKEAKIQAGSPSDE
jgi:hypothetical protein